MKNIYKYLFSTLIIFYSFLFINSIVHAADFNVDCNDSGCSKSGTEPIFNQANDGYWYPGKTLTKTINLKNSSAASKEMDIKAIQTSTVSILDNVITLTITTNPGGTTIWTGSLANFYAQSKINMGIFGSGFSQDYNFTATMDSSLGNEYQNLETVFDLTLGFWEETVAASGKTSSISLFCTNSNFDAIMELKENDIAKEGIKVKFTYEGQSGEAYTDHDGKARVGFTLSGEDKQIKAEPDNDYPSKTASINSSMCSKSSSVTTATTSTNTTPTPGGILGLFTNIFNPNEAVGEVEGEATAEAKITPSPIKTKATSTGQVQGTNTCRQCIWWQILVGELAVLISFYYFLIKKFHKKIKKSPLFGVIIPILSYLVFLWVNKNCFGGFKLTLIIPSANFFCKYFLILATILYTAVTLFWKHKKEVVIK